MSLHGCISGLLIVFCSSWVFAQTGTEAEKLKTEAETAFEHREFDKCVEATNRLIGLNPKDHGAFYLRASSHVELGMMRRDAREVRLGIEDARKALSLGTTAEVNYYLPYLLGMTTLANLDGRREHVDTVLQESQKLLTRPTLTPEQKANILFQRAGAYVCLARMFNDPVLAKESGKNFELATQEFQAAIKAFPGHLGSHVGLAESFVVAGKVDKAEAAFTAAVVTFPTNPLVFNNRGLFYHNQGKLANAVQDFNKALQIDPKYAVAYANRGFTRQAERNLPAAEADYSEAIRLEPNNPLFYSLRGTCRLSQLNVNGAAEDFTQAIRIDPQNAVAQADLGFAKFFARDYAGAIAQMDQSVTMDPKMRYVNPWRIWAMVLSGRTEGVNAIVDTSAKRTDPDWIDELVLFLNGKISEKDLVTFAEKAAEKAPDPTSYKNALMCEAYFFIGERRMLAGDKTSAIAFYEQVTKLPTVDLSAYRGALFALRAAGAR